jgi:ferric-dicitrate binding protein FerR (iron transport regulator)
MNFKEARDFAARFITGGYAPEEHAAFLQWIKEATIDELTIIADTHESSSERWVSEGPSAHWVDRLEKKLDLPVDAPEITTVMGDRESIKGSVPSIRWSAWMAAASVVVLSAGVYFYVAHTGSKADKIANGEKLLSMTFAVPLGVAQKELILEDGSKIWLNAGSSLKYPAHFTGSERVVELSGEAFFDVAGSSQSPFRVLIRDAEVDVLGTYFTIMAYDDEPVSSTTLVDGELTVVSGERKIELKPGEQVELTYGSSGVGAEMKHISGIDPKFVVEWRGGIYRFQNKELHAVTRELERIFNVTVQYQPNVGNPSIVGILDLSKGLDVVLKQLEGSVPGIRFRHEGKTVIASSSI